MYDFAAPDPVAGSTRGGWPLLMVLGFRMSYYVRMPSFRTPIIMPGCMKIAP